MNTQTERSRGHPTLHEEDSHLHDHIDQGYDGTQAGHDDEGHGEKKSVLKKVKAKAKKIKNSIVEHVGHGHELVDDEDDEMDTDPETYDTHTTQSFRPGQVGVTKQHEPRLGDRTAVEGAPVSKPGDYHTLDWTRTDTGRPKESNEQPYASKYTPVVGKERPIDMEKDPLALKESRHPQAKLTDPTSIDRSHGVGAEDRNAGKLRGILKNPVHLVRDPHAPKDPGEKPYAENYESKVSDPTGQGGEEIGATPILHQLDKMKIYQEPHQEPNVRSGQEKSMFKPKHSLEDQKISTGSHNQFSPEPVTSETSEFLQTPEPGSWASGHEREGSRTKSEQEQGSYTAKISSAAAMMADKAVQAKDVVATKLGYGGTHEGEPVQEGKSKGGSVIETVKGTISPVYGKVAEVGSTMASKVQGPSTTTGPTAGTDKGVSMREYLAEKLKPGEDDKALSDVITEALPLHKHKEEASKAGEEGEGEKANVRGRVTESEEVVRQLGRSDEASYDHAKSVLDRFKDAFGYQKSDETPTKDTAEEGYKGSSRISSKED